MRSGVEASFPSLFTDRKTILTPTDRTDREALDAFLADEIEKTKAEGTLFSLHLKATMMKVSDPIIFGHAVKEYLKPVFDKWGDKLRAAGYYTAMIGKHHYIDRDRTLMRMIRGR